MKRTDIAALITLCGATTACADMALSATPHPDTGQPVAPTVLSGKVGRSCLRGSPTPVAAYVVDGRMVDPATFKLENLRPEDVVSVEVLTGASAVQRFGEGAALGVVVLTTRRAPGQAR